MYRFAFKPFSFFHKPFSNRMNEIDNFFIQLFYYDKFDRLIFYLNRIDNGSTETSLIWFIDGYGLSIRV